MTLPSSEFKPSQLNYGCRFCLMARKVLALVTCICAMLIASRQQLPAANPTGSTDLQRADALFKAGQFAEAEKLYSQIIKRDPNNFAAAARLGSIALLSNDLDNAQKWFQQARKLRPTDPALNLLLADAYYRRDDFQKAAPLFRAAGKESKADTLASFKATAPYEIQGPGGSTTLKFVSTDPLPLVQVRINGGRNEVYFFVDTGASEVLLDADFARELGIKQFGAEQGTFAGGKKSAVGHAKINSITLGDWTVKNVPVEIVNTRQHSHLFGGKQIDGIIGTAFLYHFIATLDYPDAKLILRRHSADNLSQIEAMAQTNSVIVPFWLAGDHFLVAWGKINNLDSTLLLVDTGSASGVKLTQSALKDAGIKLQSQPFEGFGGGGKTESIPFKLKELSLGEATQTNVRGWYDGVFPWEHSLGFQVGGMIGHDFLKPYAVTFDFDGMRIILQRKSPPQQARRLP